MEAKRSYPRKPRLYDRPAATPSQWIREVKRASVDLELTTAAGWPGVAKLVASDGGACSQFAASVAIDGHTIVAGENRADDIAAASGSAYVSERTRSAWSASIKPRRQDATTSDFLGDTVAVDARTIVVGSPLDDDAGATRERRMCSGIDEDRPGSELAAEIRVFE